MSASQVLEVIFLTLHGWTVREAGTKVIIESDLPTQVDAIRVARVEAERRVELGVRTVEVRIKTKWLKRIRDARTYGHDARPPSGPRG